MTIFEKRIAITNDEKGAIHLAFLVRALAEVADAAGLVMTVQKVVDELVIKLTRPDGSPA